MNITNKSIGAFPETLQKEILRTRDLFLIEQLANEKGRKLTYCGLAGVNAYDIETWRDYISDVTVIERPTTDKERASDFESVVQFKLGRLVDGQVTVIFADIWDFLDSDTFAASSRMPDVVNLDFCGGLVTQVNLDYPKQRAAFQRMFHLAKDKGSHFLLFVTLLPRDLGKTTYKSFLSDCMTSLKSYFSPDMTPQITANQRFHERSNFTLFKACLPILLSDIGRNYNFNVKSCYIRLYTKMIHLAFRCEFVRGAFGIPYNPHQTVEILNEPLSKILPDGTGAPPEFPPII